MQRGGTVVIANYGRGGLTHLQMLKLVVQCCSSAQAQPRWSTAPLYQKVMTEYIQMSDGVCLAYRLNHV